MTLRAVARRIGISAPSIYAHFPDRAAILLAVAEHAFAELADAIRTAMDNESEAVARLRTGCAAYLDFAATRPQRYRVMFGGPRRSGDALGQDALALLGTGLAGCVAAGASASTDAAADAIALWLGLHGLAHQRAVDATPPWPPDMTHRLITLLAQLRSSR